jgi:hypothetical protein
VNGAARAATVLALTLSAACTPAAPPKAASTRAATTRSESEMFEELARRVAEARELEQRKPTPIELHDAESFGKVVERVVGRTGLPPTVVDQAAFQLAFGLAMLARESSPPFGITQREETLAFYDHIEHKIHARRVANATFEQRELVLAHEIGHSLQYQNFRMPDYHEIAAEDARMARLAVLEGDATLAMLAYVSKREHAPLSRTLVRIREQMAGPLAEFDSGSGVEGQRKRLPAMTRERLMFPYISGLAFVGEIYRAGGYAAVDRLYHEPPTSTEQVLHPARYLDGELAVEVPKPATPAGFRSIATGSLGELWVKVTLGICLDRATAATAAEGWGGDAFNVLEDGGGLGALLWLTVWDTDADAAQFFEAARNLARCWEVMQLSARTVFAGPPRVERRGRKVALVRGMPPEAAKWQARAMFALPVARPPKAPPRDAPPLRKVRKLRTLSDARVAGGAIVAPRLGIRARIPAGFSVELGEGTLVLVHGGPLPGRVIVSLTDWLIDRGSLADIFTDFVESAEEHIPDGLVSSLDRAGVSTGLGQAFLRRWSLGEGPATVSLFVVPVCNATGALLVTQVAPGPELLAPMDEFVAELEPLPGNDEGICALLDP